MTEEMLDYEKKAGEDGFSVICGVDEAGRGPLAGPVFAAAVVFDGDFYIEGLDDSKKVPEKRRSLLFDIIKEKALCCSVGMADEREIDSLNILNATFLAMQRAVSGLRIKPDIVLVDGNSDPKLCIPTRCIVKGDSKSASIAAASILAKVSRDRYMLKMDEKYPQYMFARHKGYPTKLHYKMIEKYGICDIHRRSFLKKLKGQCI